MQLGLSSINSYSYYSTQCLQEQVVKHASEWISEFLILFPNNMFPEIGSTEQTVFVKVAGWWNHFILINI